MRGFGLTLLALGAATLVLPRVGVPLNLRFVPVEYQLHTSIACVAVGAVLLLLSFRGRKKPEKK